jgi:excisionase family DNA binding protein
MHVSKGATLASEWLDCGEQIDTVTSRWAGCCVSQRDLPAEKAADLPRVFYTPREISAMTKMEYKGVVKAIKAGEIPAVKVGRCFKVPARWVREHLGPPDPVLRAVPEPAPVVVAPDYGPLASVLEILGRALVQAAGELRDSTG